MIWVRKWILSFTDYGDSGMKVEAYTWYLIFIIWNMSGWQITLRVHYSSSSFSNDQISGSHVPGVQPEFVVSICSSGSNGSHVKCRTTQCSDSIYWVYFLKTWSLMKDETFLKFDTDWKSCFRVYWLFRRVCVFVFVSVYL